MISYLQSYGEVQYIIRLLLSCLCGIIIGFERKERAKEAGIRTHCVVACASALMMIVSKYGFFDLLQLEGTGRVDFSRVAAQIVSGVGFLGSGLIFVQKNTIKGLTTAAGVWATAGIGMAIGAGMYIVGIAGTLIVLLAQILLHMNNRYFNTPRTKTFTIYGVEDRTFRKNLIPALEKMGVSVGDVFISKTGSTREYKFMIELPPTVDEEKVIELTSYDCSLK